MYNLQWVVTKWVSDTTAWRSLWWQTKKTLSRCWISCRGHLGRGRPPDGTRITCYEMLDKVLDMDRALGITYTTANRYRIWRFDSEERLKVRGTGGSCQKSWEVWVRFSGNIESQMGNVYHQTTRGFYFFLTGWGFRRIQCWERHWGLSWRK
jgi:hypothetical protein